MARFGIGQSVLRVEDQRFLTGRSRYVDDMQLPHMVHGAVLMSPHAHARIRGIDASEALSQMSAVAPRASGSGPRPRAGLTEMSDESDAETRTYLPPQTPTWPAVSALQRQPLAAHG